MKSYEEVTRDVLERSADILAQQQKRKKTRRQILLPVLGLCMVVLATVCIWHHTRTVPEPPLAEGIAAAESRSAEKSVTVAAHAVSQASSEASDNDLQDAAKPSEKTQSPTEQTEENKPSKTAVSGKSTTAAAQGRNTTTFRLNMIVDQYDAGSAACYAVPKNGECFCSVPLTEAMKHYGSSVDYKIAVHLFNHSKRVTDAAQLRQETERLAALGFCVQPSADGKAYVTIITRAENIQAFPAAQNYGYMLYLAAEPDADL